MRRIDAKRIERAMAIVAQLLDTDPAVLPIFERLQDELEKARTVEAAKRRPIFAA